MPPSDATCAYDITFAIDSGGALGNYHVPTLVARDLLVIMALRPRDSATGQVEGGRRQRLPFGAIEAGPGGPIHALEDKQLPARFADRRTYPDAELPGLFNSSLRNSHCLV